MQTIERAVQTLVEAVESRDNTLEVIELIDGELDMVSGGLHVTTGSFSFE